MDNWNWLTLGWVVGFIMGRAWTYWSFAKFIHRRDR